MPFLQCANGRTTPAQHRGATQVVGNFKDDAVRKTVRAMHRAQKSASISVASEFNDRIGAFARWLACESQIKFLHVQCVERLAESNPRRGLSGSNPILIFRFSAKCPPRTDAFRRGAALLPIGIVLSDSHRCRNGI